MNNALPPPQPEDVVAWITIRMHSSGMMSVGGTILDRKMALKMLDHAKDAITRQIPKKGIVIPNRDVEVVPNAALKELGDIPANQRGDP